MPAILKCVRVRKLALPDVAHVLTIGFQLVAPCEPRLIQPATGRVFPLRLRRHSSPDPIAIRHRIGPRDMRHRVISAIIDTRTRPLWHPPIRAVDSPPPLRTLHHLRDLSLDLNRHEILEHERPVESLGIRHMPRRSHKRVELSIRGRSR